MRIDSPVMTNAIATGSFSGSFIGTFDGDIQADSVAYANVTGKPTLVSSSAQIDHDQTTNFSADEHFTQASITTVGTVTSGDVSAILPAGVVSSSAQITITESQISDLDHYTDADVKAKLNSDAVVSGSATNVRSFLNVEDGADVTDTANVTAAGALMDSEVTNLAQVKAFDSSDYATAAQGTTADNALPKAGGQMTGNITFSGAQTVDGRDLSADGAKLDNIEANADVTDTANVTAAGALMDSEVTSLSGIKSLTVPDSTTISSFGASLVDDANAAAARTTLGVDAAGTDNSTDVTLAGGSYLTISGQQITAGTVDISSHTNLAVSDTTGQTGINLTLSGDTISGVVSGLATNSNVQFNNLTVSGDLTVSGTTTSINSTDLNVTDKLISINRGGSTAASADGGGLFISGANESITWDNGNSRFNFSDDVHVVGNVTLTGTVDGIDIAGLNSTVNNIDTAVPAIIDSSGTPAFNTGITKAEVLSILNVEDGADVTDTANVTAAGALMDSEVDADIKTLSLPANTTISAFGKTLVDDADAATARTTLGVDAAGTDNSTDVTLAGTPDYITISGQTITRNLINLTTDVTGDLPIAEGGTGASTAAAARSNLGVDPAGTDNSTDVTLVTTSHNYLSLSGQAITLGQIDISDDTNLAVSDTTGQTGINMSLTGDTISGTLVGLGTSADVQFDSLGIGTAAPGTTGVIRATNDIVAYYSSDERLKDNISVIPNALEKVESLRGVEFDWNSNQEVYSGHDIGVIAQDVEAVLPELVENRDNGYKAVKYEKLTAVLIQAVKELSAKVKELENK